MMPNNNPRWLYRASSWNATYEWVPGHGVNGSVNIGNGTSADLTEDPVLWKVHHTPPLLD